MKKNLLKVSVVLFVVLAIIATLTVSSFAKTFDPLNNESKFEAPTSGKEIVTVTENVTGAILNIVQIVAVGVAIIMLLVLAIKYISAAPNDKAEIKKHAVVYIVGALVLFASTGILELVKKFAGNIKATDEK